MRFFHRACKINNRQQKENERLQKGDKNTQGHDGQRRKSGTGQQKKDPQHQFMTGNIAKQTNGK
jgi:hypothetical protein